FVIWLGYGLGSKVLMVFLIAFFPIAVNLTTGLLLVDADLLRLMRSYRATGWQTFRTVRVPNAVPFFLAGLRGAVALARGGGGGGRGGRRVRRRRPRPRLPDPARQRGAPDAAPLRLPSVAGRDRRRALRPGALAGAVALTVGSGPPRPRRVRRVLSGRSLGSQSAERRVDGGGQLVGDGGLAS